MYLADYHTHSMISFDSEAPLMAEAARAAELGLKELCVTDHCDLIDEHGKRVYDFDWSAALEQYPSVRAAFEGKLQLKLGLELGCANADPACAAKILSGAQPDFIIGSVHNMTMEAGGQDFYYLPFERLEQCYRALDNYFDSLLSVSKLPETYDVLGHIIYPLRYMKNARDGQVTLERYEEILRAIFTAAAETGRGIELNTYCGRTLEEWLPTLKLYRACGGEIVTTGSDAHTAENIGKGIQEAQELLRAAGFRYLAVYQQRTPQFIRL